MTAVSVLPVSGDVFCDARDDGRSMRVSWHPDQDVFVLSVWRASVCVASFQVARADLPALVGSMTAALAAVPPRNHAAG